MPAEQLSGDFNTVIFSSVSLMSVPRLPLLNTKYPFTPKITYHCILYLFLSGVFYFVYFCFTFTKPFYFLYNPVQNTHISITKLLHILTAMNAWARFLQSGNNRSGSTSELLYALFLPVWGAIRQGKGDLINKSNKCFPSYQV